MARVAKKMALKKPIRKTTIKKPASKVKKTNIESCA